MKLGTDNIFVNTLSDESKQAVFLNHHNLQKYFVEEKCELEKKSILFLWSNIRPKIEQNKRRKKDEPDIGFKKEKGKT